MIKFTKGESDSYSNIETYIQNVRCKTICGGKTMEKDQYNKNNRNKKNNKKSVSKKAVIKIVIPVFIIIGLIAVWFIKNPNILAKDKNDIATENNEKGTTSSEVDEINSEEVNSDFMLNITEEFDLEQLKSYGVPIIIDFGADSCIPCKEMAPVLEKLNEELNGKAIVRFVDVWKYPDLAKKYPISVIPTQVLIDKDGNPYIPADTNSTGIRMYGSDTNEHIFTTHEGGVTEEALLGMLKEMGMEE
jgi:thioredoxin 1